MAENQCDGCRRHLPIIDGVHMDFGYGVIVCTANLETTPPLNEAELEALDGVLGESVVTADQVAEVIDESMGSRCDAFLNGIDKEVNGIRCCLAARFANLYAAADPAFDREEFLRRCGV